MARGGRWNLGGQRTHGTPESMTSPNKMPDVAQDSHRKWDGIKDIAFPMIALAPALGALLIDDKWWVGSLITISWLAGLALCRFHHGAGRNRVIAAIIITLIFVFFGWRAYLHVQNNDDLIARASNLSTEILDFIGERNRDYPRTDFANQEAFRKSTDRSLEYSDVTRDLYAKRFGPRVVAITKELDKRGLHSDELSRFAPDAVNPIGIRTIGVELGALAEQLKHSKSK